MDKEKKIEYHVMERRPQRYAVSVYHSMDKQLATIELHHLNSHARSGCWYYLATKEI